MSLLRSVAEPVGQDPTDLLLDQSATTGAPQCPMCYAHTMTRRKNGTYVCPSRCSGFVAPFDAERSVPRGARIVGCASGERFVLVQQ